eukprot:TRINITY_DN14666_c0_g1_i1.p1 TRINITY_DN14666_c0_g1~~TRINITY_DN14666_c0_g1_i1.p1  ORF type:complete len:1221 (+),score=363.97 TRINITY_DN14666_c0_g1_i1:350-3664(+)
MKVSVDPDAEDTVKLSCDDSSQWFLSGVQDVDHWDELDKDAADEGEGEELLRMMEMDTKGLTPPGWSAPLLIDMTKAAPLGGAAMDVKKEVSGETEKSRCRNPVTFITRVKEEAEAVARGEIKRKAEAPPVLDPLMSEEVANFDFESLNKAPGSGAYDDMYDWGIEEEEETVRRTWVNTALLDVSNFNDLLPNPAVKYPFELDEFQKQAIARIELNENVFVAAHTSAGKTVVAEYAIGLSKYRGTRVLYTSPIKTLSNQKYRDFKDKFSDVGIITGDVQINTDASCLIMTTEILRSMLYKDSSITSDVEYVIFDEVHYVNDTERGYVWEEIIILLPKNVKLIMLSATVPNTEAFADWVGRTRQASVNVITTYKRPVPLRHCLYYGDNEYPLLEQGKGFDAASYKAAFDLHSKKPMKPMNFQARMKNEAREWRNIIKYLEKNKRLPVIVFAFSKQKLDDLSDFLGGMNFTTKKEKAAIEAFLRQAMKRLKGSDKSIPQVTRIFRLLKKGMAVHHAGLMPIIKEVVEVLFCKGFIRVLFATETFAMGVNAPAKCVVFASTSKMDGNGKRDLYPGEYIQMSGRAGRRGLDSVGHVMMACTGGVPSQSTLKSLLTGSPVQLESKFRITYSMVLNSLISDSADMSLLLRNSFAEASSNKYFPVYCALRDKYQEELDSEEIKLEGSPDNCREMYTSVRGWVEGRKSLAARMVLDTKSAQTYLTLGKVVVVEVAPMVITLGYVVKVQGLTDMTCVILYDTANREYNPETCGIPLFMGGCAIDVVTIPRSRIVAVTNKSVVEAPPPAKGKGPAMPVMLNTNDNAALIKKGEKLRDILKELRTTDLVVMKSGDLDTADLKDITEVWMTRAKACAAVRSTDMEKCHKQQECERRAAMYDKLASDDGLYLMPEYRGRLDVLSRLGMIEPVDRVSFDYEVLPKGRCASAISSMDSVIGTELIFEGIFDDVEAPIIAACLSCFICTDKYADKVTLPEELSAIQTKILDLVTRLYEVQSDAWLVMDKEDYLSKTMNFNICEAVWEWAHGTPFLNIIEATTAREGTLIRDITRLDGLCREFKNASKLLGDTTLQAKFSECSDLIRRDVVFCTSLYVEQW